MTRLPHSHPRGGFRLDISTHRLAKTGTLSKYIP